MSDEDKDVDIESDEDDFGLPSPSGSGSGFGKGSGQFQSQADKRAHHNALERKRRDHIKDSFSSLRDAVPSLQGEKASFSVNLAQASRAQILKKAADYIQFMRRKNTSHQQDIDDLKRQNKVLEEQSKLLFRSLERARTSGSSFANSSVLETSNHINNKRDISSYDAPSASDTSDMDDDDDEEDDEEDEDEDIETERQRKKLKTSPDVTPVRI